MIRRKVIMIALFRTQTGDVIEFVVGIVTHDSTFKKAQCSQIAAQYNGSRAALQCCAKRGQNAPTKGTAQAAKRSNPNNCANRELVCTLLTDLCGKPTVAAVNTARSDNAMPGYWR